MHYTNNEGYRLCYRYTNQIGHLVILVCVLPLYYPAVNQNDFILLGNPLVWLNRS